jgi:polyhydroxyalkanoate synthesis regulator phasin
MKDFFRKTLYVGLGLANMTKEKVESAAKEIAKSAKLSEEEGRKLAEYLSEESHKAQEKMSANVKKMVDQTTKHFPTRKRIDALEARIEKLEKKLAAKSRAASRKKKTSASA